MILGGTEHNGEPQLGDDGQPYTVVGFLNGAGSVIKREAMPDVDAMAMEADHADKDAPDAATADASDATGTATDVSGSMALEAHGDRLAVQLLERLDMTTETDDAGKATSYRWIGSRGNLTQEEAIDPDYLQQALIPKSSESHSGEDVAVYASGPFAHLLNGTIEQNFLFHVMHHAAFGAE